MKQTVGNSLIVIGLAVGLYMYSAGLTGRLDFFSLTFFELLAAFVVLNFTAIMLLSADRRKLVSRTLPARLQNRVRFIR